MLISFAATNHRSLRDRCELSLVAESSPAVTDRASLAVPGFDLEVVPVVALLGSNGSGKSNVLSAVDFAAEAIRRSQAHWRATNPPPRDAFRSRDGTAASPSVYELTFAVESEVYEYEFAIGAGAIEFERLFVSPHGPRSRTRLYERHASQRDASAQFEFGRRLKGPRAAAEAATRPNSLFLSSAAQNNHRQLVPVWHAITTALRSASPNDRGARSNYTARRLFTADKRYHRRIQGFLSSADLGIADVHVHETRISEEAVEMFRRVAAVLDIAPAQLSEHEMIELSTTLSHRGDVGRLDLSEESAGTQAWFEWAAPVIDTLDDGAILGADELDSHLTEHLAAKVIDSFQNRATNRHGAQLIFTAQDASVITRSNLARDQVWIAEKSIRGDTTLAPVTDFSPRKDWEIGRAFRHGRFGGLPVVDDDDFMTALLGTGGR